jgi:hypothetical protein
MPILNKYCKKLNFGLPTNETFEKWILGFGFRILHETMVYDFRILMKKTIFHV